MVVRSIVRIDEQLCDGCGLCVTPCVEGAIQVVNGKAKVLREELCDGAGFCLSVCPTGALSIEQRESAEFSDQVGQSLPRGSKPKYIAQKCFRCEVEEEHAVLLPCRSQGRSLWVCTHCLPALIHG